jgi:pimeloyl-ACP methyl ester carboxylesterase
MKIFAARLSFRFLSIAVLAVLASCAPATSPNAPSIAEVAPAPRLPGMEKSEFALLAGERVYFEVGGQGSPVVMVHGIGAGNSSHLWRENTAQLAKTHRVYAFDFPGFARSGARAIQYTNDLYTQVLREFIRDVVKERSMVVAGSLGADYTIRLAVESPELISRMLLSNPSGYDLNKPDNKQGRTLLTTTSARNQGLYEQFANTFLGDLIFTTLQSPAGLNFFLYNYVYLDWRRVNDSLTNIYRENLQGPNKKYAPFSFFAGFLEQPVVDLWSKATQPTLLVWGKDDIFTPIRFATPMLEARKDVQFEVLNARAIPYDEDFVRFNQLADAFLK